MLLIEGKHYRRRLERFLPVPKPSKEVVACLLYGDPKLDAEEEHDARKRDRTRGRNICLDKWMRHCISEHPDGDRDGNQSSLSFGFTRQGVRDVQSRSDAYSQ